MRPAAAAGAVVAIAAGTALTFAAYGSGTGPRITGVVVLVAGMVAVGLLLRGSRGGVHRRGDRRQPVPPRAGQRRDEAPPGPRESPSPVRTRNAPQPYPPARHGYDRPAPEGAYRPRETRDRATERLARYTTRH